MSQTPLTPIYPFGSPGGSIKLYQGPIAVANATGAAREGEIHADLSGELRVRWSLSGPGSSVELGSTALQIEHPELGTVVLPAHADDSGGEGEIEHAELGDPGAPLDSVLVHFANLPWILPGTGLRTERANWTGRWTGSAAGWDLVLDVRSDHAAATRAQRNTVASVITHTSQLRRSNRQPFTGRDAADALYAWQMAFSFALGRWAAPVAPVGFDANGRRVWEQWASWRNWPPLGHLSWWDRHNGDDLRAFCRLFLEAWYNPAERDVVRHVAHHLIAANHRGTTVEARIMLVQAALEYLSWVTYVLSGRRSATEHQRGKARASAHLLELLLDAGIPAEIPRDLAALRQYAEEEGLADGPTAVTALRNRLVHPKDISEPYRVERLVSDAWRLVAEYGELLLLYRLGYQGDYLPRTKIGLWEFDRVPVPWTERASAIRRRGLQRD